MTDSETATLWLECFKIAIKISSNSDQAIELANKIFEEARKKV